MATSGGYNYRNGTQRGSLKVDRPLSVNSNPKSVVKSKSLSGSGVRRNSTGSLVGATGASKDDAGGWFLALLCFGGLKNVNFRFSVWLRSCMTHFVRLVQICV